MATTSTGDLAPLLGLLLVGCAGSLHLWRARRDRALYTRRAG